jgi:hypothetical protein
MQYNLNHSRSKFQLGDKVVSSDLSGTRSNQLASVVRHFSSPSTDRYKEMGWVPVRWDNDQSLDYFPKNRLKIAEGREVFFVVDGNGDNYTNLWYPSHNEAIKVALKQNGLYVKKEFRKTCKTCPSLLAPCGNDCLCK